MGELSGTEVADWPSSARSGRKVSASAASARNSAASSALVHAGSWHFCKSLPTFGKLCQLLEGSFSAVSKPGLRKTFLPMLQLRWKMGEEEGQPSLKNSLQQAWNEK